MRLNRVQVGAVVVALVPLAVYVLTLQNGFTPGELQGGDPITHQYAQALFRFANAPGYPIFSMLGALWFRLSAMLTPFFNPVERLSFYSTLYAIPSLILTYSLLLKAQLSGKPAGTQPSVFAVCVSALATLFFAFTYFFWYYSVSSENYSSGVLNTLAIILLAIHWQERRDEGTLLWLCFACGLSLAHLLTTALAVPAVIIFVVAQQPKYLRQPVLIAKIVAVTALPLLSYAFVYWRAAEHPEWRGQGAWPDTLTWFLKFLTVPQGQAEMTLSWDGIPWILLQKLTADLTPVVLVLGIAGLFLLPRARAGLMLGVLAVYVPEVYLNRYGNWYQTTFAVYPLLLIGCVLLAERVRRWTAVRLPPRIVAGTLVGAFALLAASRIAVNYAATNLRDRPTATGLNPGWVLLADKPKTGAVIAGTFEENLALDYLAQVWGAQPPVATIGLKQVNAALGGPLYASRAVLPLVAPQLPPDTHLSSQGTALVALRVAPETMVPSSASVIGKPIVPGLQLAAYETRRTATGWRVTLYWQATQSIARDMAVSVRLVKAGAEVAQADAAHPVGGYYPFTHWQAGEVVRDDYVLTGASDADTVRVILYHTQGGGFVNDVVVEVAKR